MSKSCPPVAQNFEKIVQTDRRTIQKAKITVTDFQLHNLGRCSKIPIHYAMFRNFDGIENGGFHRLSAQCIVDDSGPLNGYKYLFVI